MIKDCVQRRHTIVIENEGRPEICEEISKLEFCKANHKEIEENETNQSMPVYYRYKIGIGDDGHPIFICLGKYD